MKKILFVLMSLVMSMAVFAKDSKFYCLYFGEELANNGYVKSTYNIDEYNNILTIKLIGDWETISAGENDIHTFPKLTLDRLLVSWPKRDIVSGWFQRDGHLIKQIRIERNMIEFDIPINHDIVYIHEYIDKYSPKTKSLKSHNRSKRTNKRK